MRMMVGLIKPTNGEIEISGKPVIFGREQTNKMFGYLPEQPAFYSWMTGEEYLSYIGDIFGLKGQEKRVKIEEQQGKMMKKMR